MGCGSGKEKKKIEYMIQQRDQQLLRLEKEFDFMAERFETIETKAKGNIEIEYRIGQTHYPHLADYQDKVMERLDTLEAETRRITQTLGQEIPEVLLPGQTNDQLNRAFFQKQKDDSELPVEDVSIVPFVLDKINALQSSIIMASPKSARLYPNSPMNRKRESIDSPRSVKIPTKNQTTTLRKSLFKQAL